MEKEIGSEAEMEEGMEEREEKKKGNEEIKKQNRVNVCLFSPFGHLFQFSKFTQDPLQRRGRS